MLKDWYFSETFFGYFHIAANILWLMQHVNDKCTPCHCLDHHRDVYHRTSFNNDVHASRRSLGRSDADFVYFDAAIIAS